MIIEQPMNLVRVNRVIVLLVLLQAQVNTKR